MARLGRPPALTSTTVVYLPFQEGANLLTDRSSGALAVSQVGTGSAPYWAAGPYGDGCAFSSATKHLSMAAITFAGSLTVEAHIRTDDGGNLRTVVCQRDQTGTQLSVFRLAASNSSVAFTVYDAAASSETITAALPFPSASTRSFHVRAVYDAANLMLLIFVDGWLAAKKSTAIAALPAATLPIIEIGGESSNVLTSVFAGRLAHVRILSTAEITTDGLAPNLRASVLARRDIQTVELGPLSDLSDNTAWVIVGPSEHYLPMSASAFTLGRFITQPQDVIAVKGKIGTGTGSTSTTFIEVGNLTDLRATASAYCVDMIYMRLYLSANPLVFDSLEVEIRLPLAGRGEMRGTRYYLGALISTGDPRRGFAYPGDQFDTGGGGTMIIDGSHAGLPDGWTSEEAGGVIWTGARAYIASRPLGAPWSSRIATFAGYVDQPPGDSAEVVSLALVTDLGALHRTAGATCLIDLVTYPNVYQPHEGAELSAPIGYGILGVPLYCIDATPQTIDSVTNLYKYAWSGLNTSRLRVVRLESGSPIPVYHVDLAASTCYIRIPPVYYAFVADVDGLCLTTPSTATSTGLTTLPYGTTNDLAKTPVEILKSVLYQTLGLAAADYNASVVADYATRALGWYRYDTGLAAEGAFASWLTKAVYDFLGCLYVEPYTEGQPTRWAIKDVNTAEAVVGTLRDVDLLAESYPKDYGNLASRLEGGALVYWRDQQNNLKNEVSAAMALTVDRKYRLHRRPLNLGLRGQITESNLHTWMDMVSGLHETPRRNLEGSLSRRWLATSQMDAITNASTQLPTGIGTRFRVKSMAPRAGSVVGVAAFPEQPFPTDGTQGAPSRDPVGPMFQFRAHWQTGKTVTTTGAWTRVGNYREPYMGGFGPCHAAMDHLLTVRAVRSGGASDTDFQLRLYDVTNSLVLATITTGVSTTVGNFTTTTFANIPATTANLELQYYLAAGVSGTVYDGVWSMAETTDVSFLADLPSTSLYGWGYAPGITPLLYGTTTTGSSNNFYIGNETMNLLCDPEQPFDYYNVLGLSGTATLHAGNKRRLVIDADLGNMTDLRFGFCDNESYWTWRTIQEWPYTQTTYYTLDYTIPVTGGRAFYEVDCETYPINPKQSPLNLCVVSTDNFNSPGATAKIYGIKWAIRHAAPIR